MLRSASVVAAAAADAEKRLNKSEEEGRYAPARPSDWRVPLPGRCTPRFLSLQQQQLLRATAAAAAAAGIRCNCDIGRTDGPIDRVLLSVNAHARTHSGRLECRTHAVQLSEVGPTRFSVFTVYSVSPARVLIASSFFAAVQAINSALCHVVAVVNFVRNYVFAVHL